MIVINNDYANIKVGTIDLQRLYAGGTLIWELESPTPTDYSKQFLTLIALDSGTFQWTPAFGIYDGIQYSLDSGQTWTQITTSDITLNVNSGDVVMWAGGNRYGGIGSFSASTASFNVEGNALSLIWGKDDGFYETEFPSGSSSGRNFYRLFYKTKVVDASNLILQPTTCTIGCYEGMFDGCSGLTAAPQLPATTLAQGCYEGMFQGCTSLTTAPELPSTSLTDNCYAYMFSGCSNLHYIKMLAKNNITAETNNGNATYKWVSNVASTGTFVKDPSPTINIGDYGIPYGWIVEGSYSSEYFTTIVVSGSNLYWSGSTTANTLSYSKNNGEWTTPESAITINVVAGDIVRWKGVEGQMTTRSGSNYVGIGSFKQTAMQNPAIFDCQGNVMSLLYGDNFIGQTDLSSYPYAFYSLLSRTEAREIGNIALPATTLSECCYASIFNGCTSATTAPTLPATTMAASCYDGMFNNCYSLAQAPELPAITLARGCYSYMFGGCSGLTTAPQLQATTLSASCYSNMFRGCTSLTTAPQLPSTALTSNCYKNMFMGCTSLTTAPDLLATDLTNNCYDYMFSGCTSLNYIKAMFTTTPTASMTNNWVNGVAATGTFVKNANATWNVVGVNGVPSNWTIQTA